MVEKNYGLVANIVVKRKSKERAQHKNVGINVGANVGLKYGYMRIIKKRRRFILRIIKTSDKMCA